MNINVKVRARRLQLKLGVEDALASAEKAVAAGLPFRPNTWAGRPPPRQAWEPQGPGPSPGSGISPESAGSREVQVRPGWGQQKDKGRGGHRGKLTVPPTDTSLRAGGDHVQASSVDLKVAGVALPVSLP